MMECFIQWSRSKDTGVFLLVRREWVRTGQCRHQDTGHCWPGCDWSGHHWPVPARLPLVSGLASAGPVSVSSPHWRSQISLQTSHGSSSEPFIVIALACLLFDKVISMRYPWIKVFKSAHEVPIYDFVARYRLWADGAASHKENIILWPSNNPTQMRL